MSGREDTLWFDAVDFPSVIFRHKAVEKRSNRPVCRTKQNLDNRRCAVHSHHSKLHPTRARHGRVIVANQGLELRERKFLVNIGGGMLIGARKIVSAKCGELVVYDRIQFTRRRCGNHSLSKIMRKKSCRGAEREKENKEPGLR